MKTVLKFLMISIGLILMAIGIVGIVIFTRTQTSKTALEQALTVAFGAETRIESVAFAPWEQAIILYGLQVENPPNFLPGAAIEAERTRIEFDLPSFFSETPSISLVGIENAVFHMRHELGEGANLAALLQNRPEAESQADVEAGRRFSFERLELNGAKLALSSDLAPDKVLNLDVAPIAVADPAGVTPSTVGEASRAILADALQGAMSAEGLASPMADKLRDSVQGLRSWLSNE
jgi:uncharacterized protein involved in outer membrane biogenesis